MSIGKIGGNDNPFLKLNQNEGLNSAGKSGDTNAVNQPKDAGPAQKTNEAQSVKKTGNEEGAASSNANPQGTVDKSQFTNENEMQEIDLQEFEDDF